MPQKQCRSFAVLKITGSIRNPTNKQNACFVTNFLLCVTFGNKSLFHVKTPEKLRRQQVPVTDTAEATECSAYVLSHMNTHT